MTRFYWDDDLYPAYALGFDYAWWWGCPGEEYAHVVGLKLPNEFGLYDMSGNVCEWCQDWYHDSYADAPTDGSAWESPVGAQRVVRGGSWLDSGWGARSASRFHFDPANTYADYGFRLVR
jgi:formylglycine-generating enzyme required for sulfatase activity